MLIGAAPIRLKVARLGVHRALSFPLITAEGVVGAMNVYAHGKDAFNERAAEIGELFAVPAAIAVKDAQILSQTKRLAAQLQTALSSRAVIDRAIGIVMSRKGVLLNKRWIKCELLARMTTKSYPLQPRASSMRRFAVRRLGTVDSELSSARCSLRISARSAEHGIGFP